MIAMFILFDFDGVIANTFQTGFGVRKRISPSITEEEYRNLFLLNINDSLKEKAKLSDHNPNIDFFSEFRPGLMESPVFPSMKETIDFLARKNSLLIISSTTTDLIEEYLEMHELKHAFKGILGNEVHASKSEKIKMVFEKYGVQAADCVFVTDTVGDINEAKQVGVPVIAVTWGYQDGAVLSGERPWKVVDTPGELIAEIERLNS